ncbi:MAG TPA: FGGY family carbohydrate kinase [Acidimicrobiales bacterium]|nr:FGGY family carbohydrate kinase [Acidimicrobiales bacterium]
MILTIDLGSSATKAALWAHDRLVAVGRAPLRTLYGDGGIVEQKPSDWWGSVVEACSRAREGKPAFEDVDGIAMSAARQTFVPVDGSGFPLGPGILWSDRRASKEATEIAEKFGGSSSVHRRTGTILDGASVSAKFAWLETHERERFENARWMLAPRDVMLHRMTGIVATDDTLASATGLYDLDGKLVPWISDSATEKLPESVAPVTVIGPLLAEPSAELGVSQGVPVVIGAGDRPSEVVGAGASSERAMVSWGTTANLSLPIGAKPLGEAEGLSLTRAALDGWLLEGGLSAAGSLVSWLEKLTNTAGAELMEMARACPEGARGVVVAPWAGGARAPWWRDGARAGVIGLSLDHGAGEVARAVVEAVAWDVRRCMDAVRTVTLAKAVGPIDHGGDGVSRPRIESLALTGSGTRSSLWVDVVTAVSGLRAVVRRSGEAASAGAAIVGSSALGSGFELDRIDPIVERVTPSRDSVKRYEELRPAIDRTASTLVDLVFES